MNMPCEGLVPPGRIEFGRLKASPRMSIRSLSRSWKVRDRDMLMSENDGPVISPGLMFPSVPSCGSANAFTLSQLTHAILVGHGPPLFGAYGSTITRFGRWFATAFSEVSAVSVTVNRIAD